MILKSGSISHEVSEWQLTMTRMGYPVTVDGIFGPETKNYTILFQQDFGLSTDGIVGPITKAKAAEVLASKVPVEALAGKDFTETLISVTQRYVGIRESGGANRGRFIDGWLKDVGVPTGLPWCMAFVQGCFKEAARVLDMPDPLKPDTPGVLDLWNRVPAHWRVGPRNGQRGDIMIMDMGKGKGHTGIVVSRDGTGYRTIEGNTNDAGSSEGDGVYEKTRMAASAKLRGFIRVPVGGK